MRRAIAMVALIACRPNGESLERTCASGRFEVYATTVRDTQTHKVWEKNSPPMKMSYADAQKHCASLSMKLPSNFSLIDLMKTGPSDFQPVDACAFPTPPIDASLDGAFAYGVFWTMTPNALPVVGKYLGENPDRRVVVFGNGQLGSDDPNGLNRVRCVRE